MRKSLTYKVLAAVMALSAANWAVPANVLADEYIVKQDGEIISDDCDGVYGNGYSFTINGSTINGNVYGAGNGNIDYDKDASGGNVTINGNAEVTGEVYGGRSGSGSAHHNTVNISGNNSEAIVVYGGRSAGGTAHHNTVNISGGTIGSYYGSAYVYGGRSDSTDSSAHHNIVNIRDGTIGSDQWSAYVYGGRSAGGTAHHNTVNISGGTIGSDQWPAYVYGGYISENVNNNTIDNNEIIISGSADIKNANLYGRNDEAFGIGNTLTIDGWSDSTNSVQNFNDIAFKNISWDDDEPVLTITAGNTGDLTNTKIDTIHIAGGSNINVGESMTLIKSNIDLTNEVIGETNKNFTAGVAREGLGSTSIDGKGNVTFNVNSIKLSSQAVSAAQTRAASAAFVNQGTDLISDSLDTISRDDNYGVKTFAAVHGNRSKYDVADDIKINGWSTIVGVGNADKFDNGSEFSWGVFYENGSGNYRTYNNFNNEFFRGDGSMVYNGGGIAARYENKNGVYTEGSLRAGMLKNELDNAMRNVNGSYGYETESAYYGAHIGVGKIISLSDSSDLDIYGKFFHTYTEGDSVTIADDKFDFDSITSDRLRVGARITSNKENKFSTYYGLAYEYEFNGDADMTAQGLRADTQSLQGSSVMAEIGFNYQPTPDSPWSFDLNMRGYAGERQGGSFNVQATYTF